MIGSLVVLLPSESKGGALLIEHHDEKVSYRGSPNQLVLVAFYADCRHEVRQVTSGYRAALTFNLFLDAAAHRTERPASKPVDTLIEFVRDYFATPRPARGPLWPSQPAPERLVYLLDHEYTQKGLSWKALKNGGLLAAAALADDRDLQSTIVARLAPERGYPIAGALAVLRAGAPHGAAMLGLGPLHDDCVCTLTKLVAAPPRAPGDWSIMMQLRCKCELCARMGRFLRAANERQLDWPLAKDRRAHVHGMITSHELPVTHVTRRTGSPYTLVLTKTQALFTRDATERATWMRDLAWLRENAKAPRRVRARRK